MAIFQDDEQVILESALLVAESGNAIDGIFVIDGDLRASLSGLYIRPDERAIYIRRPYDGFLSASFRSEERESRNWSLNLNYTRLSIELIGMETAYLKMIKCYRYYPGAWTRCSSKFKMQKQPIKLKTEVLDGALHDLTDKLDFTLVPVRDFLQVHYKAINEKSGRKVWLSRKNFPGGRILNFTWTISERLAFISSGDCEDLARLDSKIWSVQDLGTQRWNMNERFQKIRSNS